MSNAWLMRLLRRRFESLKTLTSNADFEKWRATGQVARNCAALWFFSRQPEGFLVGSRIAAVRSARFPGAEDLPHTNSGAKVRVVNAVHHGCALARAVPSCRRGPFFALAGTACSWPTSSLVRFSSLIIAARLNSTETVRC